AAGNRGAQHYIFVLDTVSFQLSVRIGNGGCWITNNRNETAQAIQLPLLGNAIHNQASRVGDFGLGHGSTLTWLKVVKRKPATVKRGQADEGKEWEEDSDKQKIKGRSEFVEECSPGSSSKVCLVAPSFHCRIPKLPHPSYVSFDQGLREIRRVFKEWKGLRL